MLASLLAYLVGVSVAIGIGIITLMPLQSVIERAPAAAPIATLLRLRMPFGLRLLAASPQVNHKTVDQKKALPNQKHVMVH